MEFLEQAAYNFRARQFIDQIYELAEEQLYSQKDKISHFKKRILALWRRWEQVNPSRDISPLLIKGTLEPTKSLIEQYANRMVKEILEIEYTETTN